MLSDDRRLQLSDALEAAFSDGPAGLREIASLYVAEGLARKLPENPNLASLVQTIVTAEESVLESVLRFARRRRPDRQVLAHAIAGVWPFADGLDFERTDQLRAHLVEAEVSLEALRLAAKAAVGAELPPLWPLRGPDPLGDVIEGLAQLPHQPLKLVLVAQRFRDVPAVTRWLDGFPPCAPAEVAAAFTCRQRMLVLLRRGVNDNYKGDIYFAGTDRRPRFVAALREQAPLADIATMFSVTRCDNDDLRGALLDAELDLIEVMLPVRDLLTRVEQWDLLGSGPIGELFPVVVRPLERAFAMQHPDYVGGAMMLRKSWGALQRAPTIRRLELEPAQVAVAVLQHPMRWCVAAFRCPEPSHADRLLEIDRLVKRGVAAMLTVRHEQAWPDHLTPEAGLPAAVHLHRCDHPGQPVTLLWDDAEFNPGSRK